MKKYRFSNSLLQTIYKEPIDNNIIEEKTPNSNSYTISENDFGERLLSIEIKWEKSENIQSIEFLPIPKRDPKISISKKLIDFEVVESFIDIKFLSYLAK